MQQKNLFFIYDIFLFKKARNNVAPIIFITINVQRLCVHQISKHNNKIHIRGGK